jgi:hypothetical protein
VPTSLDEERLRARRGRVVTAVAAVVLLALLGGVWAAGGFGYRQDLFTPVDPGALVRSGPFELTLTEATVQHKTSSDGYEVTVLGTARTTGDESISPAIGSGGFVFAQDRATREVQPASSFRLGATDSFFGPDSLTPGLPPVPVAASFRFPTAPAGPLRVVVYEQEFTTAYVLSDELAWRSTRKGAELMLPVRRLPDTEY